MPYLIISGIIKKLNCKRVMWVRVGWGHKRVCCVMTNDPITEWTREESLSEFLLHLLLTNLITLSLSNSNAFQKSESPLLSPLTAMTFHSLKRKKPHSDKLTFIRLLITNLLRRRYLHRLLVSAVSGCFLLLFFIFSLLAPSPIRHLSPVTSSSSEPLLPLFIFCFTYLSLFFFHRFVWLISLMTKSGLHWSPIGVWCFMFL